MPSAAPEDPAVMAEADNEAARSILADATWQEVHHVWERRTQVPLSPKSFGNRIVPVVDKYREAQQPQPHDYHSSSTHHMQRQASADRTQRQLPPPPPPQQQQQPQQHPPPPRHARDLHSHPNGRYSPAAANGPARPPPRPDSFEQQRADINRIDSTLASLQHGMADLTHLIHQLRSDIHSSHSPHLRANGEDRNLELLSATVSNVSNKAGEIDGMKINMATLTRRLKQLEDANGTPSTPSLPDANFPRPASNGQFAGPPPPPPPQQQAPQTMPARPAQLQAPPPPSLPHHPQPQPQQAPMEPRAWNAVNVAKRKSPSEADGYDLSPNGAPKRPRPLHASSSDGHLSQGSAAPPPPPHPQGPPTLAPIRSISSQGQQSSPPELWRPAPGSEPRLPPLQGMPPGSRGIPPPSTPRGRPEPLDVPPPPHHTPWAREQWEEGRPANDYYRPIEGVAMAGSDPRGGLIRRGTGGGGALQYMDPNVPTKRTRQRPIRNSDGILIRKDGKPDQRSISSPQNLRKVHARKMAEQEASRIGGSPLANDTGSQDSEEGSALSSPQDEESAQHREVMGKMFPHGMDEAEGHGLSRRRARNVKDEESQEEDRSSNASGGSRRSSSTGDGQPMEIDARESKAEAAKESVKGGEQTEEKQQEQAQPGTVAAVEKSEDRAEGAGASKE